MVMLAGRSVSWNSMCRLSAKGSDLGSVSSGTLQFCDSTDSTREGS